MKTPPKKKPAYKNPDARRQRVAILEAIGQPVKEITKCFPVSKQTIYNDRMTAYEKGEVQAIQEPMVENVKDMVEERRILANYCIKANIAKAKHISEKDGKSMKLKEAEFCLKAFGETEHSGRKVDAPVININMKEKATLNIQQNMADIGKILERSGVDLEGLVTTEN